jgi:SAM-dependent methyltransferase
MDYWYAYVYEQQEAQTEDVEFLLSVVGTEAKRILEVACGGGRLCIPLAQAGHSVTGFDMDAAMLERAWRKAGTLPNLTCYQADALASDWGKNFEIVVMAGNIFINIVTAGDYRDAQRLFLQKASACLEPAGHLYLDFDCVNWANGVSEGRREWVCFEGSDDRGTYGKYIVLSGNYDSHTRVDRSGRRYEIAPRGSEAFVMERNWIKHFPTLEETCSWLYEAGFTVEQLYGGHGKQPFSDENRRLVIWAKKL